MDWQGLNQRYSLENVLQRAKVRKKAVEHWKWKLLAKVAGVQMGRRLAIGAIKEGESKRLGDRMILEGGRYEREVKNQARVWVLSI